jgi:hypothetical protein
MAKLDDEDLNAIQSLIDLSTEKVEEKLTSLKSDIFDKIDSFAKENEASHQERIVLSAQSKRNTGRIEKLETKVFGRISQ